MTIETPGMADVAGFLLGNRLFVGEREIDLFDDLFCVFEGEFVAFRPADRPGVRKGRPSVIGTVDVGPYSHGALPQVRAHHARGKLFHLFGMAA